VELSSRNLEQIEKMRQLERDMGGTEERIAALGSKSDVWNLSQSPNLDAAERSFGDGFRRFETEMHTPNM